MGWMHWRTRKIRRALQTLSKAMREDPDFANSWKANIAMPICDATRPSCTCQWDAGHQAHCAIVRAHNLTAGHGIEPMPQAFANHIAARLMKHLFDVDCDDSYPKKEAEVWPPVQLR